MTSLQVESVPINELYGNLQWHHTSFVDLVLSVAVSCPKISGILSVARQLKQGKKWEEFAGGNGKS